MILARTSAKCMPGTTVLPEFDTDSCICANAAEHESGMAVGTEKTANGETGRTGFQKQCTDDPYPAELAACSFVHMEAVGRQGPPLSTQGPRPAILKYQGSDPTQPYPTFVVRHIATLLDALRLRGNNDVVRPFGRTAR